ncbi:MAG: galactose mutarotase [Mariniblastus sp.]|nr:galactose mutarotase [Mariniblastus sp.]
MKIALCLAAFVIGCLTTVNFSRENPTIEPLDRVVLLGALSSNETTTSSTEMGVTTESFGKTANGQPVTKYTCTNAHGLVLEMIDYGATVISMKTPDADGKLANITLSCQGVSGYEACGSYFGSTVGRYCNRIAKGKFSIGGKEYSLATNNDPNHLHGGVKGFDKQIWQATPIQQKDGVGVKFKLKSKDGDEGYPGELDATAIYLLNNQNELVVELKAKTDQATHVNLTNHNYWNLAGEGAGKVFDHQLKVDADRYIPIDATGIPTGELAKVDGTAFDFKNWHRIGERIGQISTDPAGYDHCYALNNQSGELEHCASVWDPKTGRVMEIHTTLPGLQFYTGNFLDGSEGSGGFDQYNAFCLETQRYPDTPNQPKFPSTLLKPGDEYHEKTVHKFSVSKEQPK